MTPDSTPDRDMLMPASRGRDDFREILTGKTLKIRHRRAS
jgi:hypothetical protein